MPSGKLRVHFGNVMKLEIVAYQRQYAPTMHWGCLGLGRGEAAGRQSEYYHNGKKI